MRDNIHLKLSIKDGKLHFPVKAYKTKYEKFLKDAPEGARVELFLSIADGKGTNAQLARIHAMCRELANAVGYTFEEMKLQIKRKAGLCFMKNKVEYCRSFADCDSSELNLAIQACIEIGDFNGMQLR